MGSFPETYNDPRRPFYPGQVFFLYKAEPSPLPTEQEIGEGIFLRGGEGASVHRKSAIPITRPINRSTFCVLAKVVLNCMKLTES